MLRCGYLVKCVCRVVLARSLKYCQVTVEKLKRSGIEVMWHGKRHNEGSHYCAQCEVQNCNSWFSISGERVSGISVHTSRKVCLFLSLEWQLWIIFPLWKTLQRSYATLCACWKYAHLKFFKSLVYNPCQSSPSLIILVYLWFLVISWVFRSLSKLSFSGFFNSKVILYLAKVLWSSSFKSGALSFKL